MLSRPVFLRLALVMATLLAAALACNLQVGDESPAQTAVPAVAQPTVEILEPSEGANFTRGQTVSIRARATGASGVTLIELLVNGVRVDSQIPADTISQPVLDVVLDYKAEQVGPVILSVRAYSNAIAGQPAQRVINVLDPLSPGTGAGTTPQTLLPPSATPFNPLCRARVDTGLNFRTGPGLEYDIITTLVAGTEPPIQGYADRADGRWWQVVSGGRTGWIKESYTTQLGDCGTIRPVAVPASPTPKPSATPQPTAPGTTATPTLPDLSLSTLDGANAVTLGVDNTAKATYTIRVKNTGGQASSQFVIAVALPNGQVQNYDVPGLNPGQDFQIPSGGLVITFDSPGVKRLLITVDALNTVAESNEGNNQVYLDITVNASPATATSTP